MQVVGSLRDLHLSLSRFVTGEVGVTEGIGMTETFQQIVLRPKASFKPLGFGLERFRAVAFGACHFAPLPVGGRGRSPPPVILRKNDLKLVCWCLELGPR